MTTNWRAMGLRDIAAVCRVADVAHPDFPEDEAIFLERLHLAPNGCFVLDLNGKIEGYLLSHPWDANAIPPLNTLLGSLPEAPGTWYLHDLALMPDARAGGRTKPLIAHMLRTARDAGLPSLSLVAVNASVPYWTRFGFVDATTEKLREKLKSYDDAARYLVLRV